MPPARRASASVRVDRGALQTALVGQRGAATSYARRIGREVLNEAQRQAPSRTGRLRNSLYMDLQVVGDSVIVDVATRVRYAEYVVEGTGIYGPAGRRITPTEKKALRLRGLRGRRGRVKFAASVTGSRPNDFLTRALVRVAGRSRLRVVTFD